MLLNRERAIETMDRHGLDALVATTPVNVYYLSDYGTEHSFHFAPWGLSCAILPRSEEIPATLIVQEWEVPHVSERPSWMPELRVQTGVETYIPAVADLGASESRLHDLWSRERGRGAPNRQRLLGQTLIEFGLGSATLGFDDLRVMAELHESELRDARPREAINVFREIRIIKTSDELSLLGRAARINQASLQTVANIVSEGVTCRELIDQYKVTMASQRAYGSHMTGGGGSHPWLSHPDLSYRVKDGDIVHLDPAGHYEHYWADLGRSAVLGRPSEKFKELYGVLQDVHGAVDPMLQPGVSTAKIKDEARKVAKGRMTKGFLPLLHSIGIEQYDHPQSLGEFLGEDFILERNMTVNFETLYFELGWGMLQLEDTYLIGSDPPGRLATLAQEPFECPIGQRNKAGEK